MVGVAANSNSLFPFGKLASFEIGMLLITTFLVEVTQAIWNEALNAGSSQHGNIRRAFEGSIRGGEKSLFFRHRLYSSAHADLAPIAQSSW